LEIGIHALLYNKIKIYSVPAAQVKVDNVAVALNIINP
jgi:hypothetical protein